jgi:hypothetical protein
MINNTDQNVVNFSGWLKKHQELNERLAQNLKPELFKKGGKVKRKKKNKKKAKAKPRIEIGLPPNPMQRPFYPITFGATGYSGPAVTNQPTNLYEELKKAQKTQDEFNKTKQEDYDRQIAELTQQVEDLQSQRYDKPFRSALDMGASSSMSSSSSGVKNEIPDLPAQLGQHRAVGAQVEKDDIDIAMENSAEYVPLEQDITSFDIFAKGNNLFILKNQQYVRWYTSQLSQNQKQKWIAKFGRL